MGADAHDAVLVQVLGGVLAHVRDVGGELLHAALGLADLGQVLVHVDGSEDVPLHHLLAEDDGVLVVVTLPRHEGDLQVAAERELAGLGGVAFGEDLALHDLVTLPHERLEVDRGGLVGAAVDRELVHRLLGLEAHELLVLGAVVLDADLVGVDISHETGAVRDDLRAGVDADALLQAGAHDRGFRAQERNGLTHHVRTHQGAVRVVVLQERDQGRSHGSHLVRGDVHVVDLLLGDQREVGLQAALDAVAEELAVVGHLHVGEGDVLVLFLFRAHVVPAGVAQVHLTVVDLAVRGLDEAELVDAGIHAQGRDQTDVRAFRRLDRAQAAVVRVVHVADLEAGAVTGKTAGAEGAETALVGDFGERVRLVHELGELARAEERIDHGGQGLRVDQVDRVELLAVTDVHPFADGAGHAAQTDAELVGELLAHRADAAVGEVVDIVDRGPGVDQGDQVLDDLDDVGVGEHTDTRVDRQAELLVQAVTAHASEVIALLGEEELVDDVAGGGLVRRFGVAELLVDEVDSFDLRIGRVLLQGVVDDGVLGGVGLVLLQQDGLDISVQNFGDGVVVELLAAVDDGERTFDGDHLAGVLVLEILGPRLEDLGGEEAATVLLEGSLVGGDLIGQSEDVDDVLVAVVADGPEEGGHGELLLPVDVGIHHAVDVRRELDPGSLERDDAGGIQLGPVGVHALVEEHARGPVKLGNDDSL